MKAYKTILTTFVAGVTAISMFVYINNFLFKPQAGATSVNFSFAPSSETIATGSDKTVVLTMQLADSGSNKIAGLDLTLKTEGEAKIKEVQTPFVIGVENSGSLFNEIKKEVSAQSVRLSYVIIKPDNELPQTVSFNVVITAQNAGNGKITVDKEKTQVVSQDPTIGFYPLGTVGEGSYTFTSGGTTPSPTPPIPPAGVVIPTPGVTKTGPARIVAEVRNQNNKKISGVIIGRADCDANRDAKKTCDFYNRTSRENPHDFPKGDPKHEYIGAVLDLSGTSHSFIRTSANPEGSRIDGCHLGRPKLTCLVWPKNSFTQGTRKVIFQINAPDPKPQPPTPCLTCAIQIEIQARFQGIVGQDKLNLLQGKGTKLLSHITLEKGSLQTPISKQIEFVPDSLTPEGGIIWKGTVGFDAADGSTFEIFIKGPRHLRKRICDTAPSETVAGSYKCNNGKINLKKGKSTLNFSKVFLMSGDVDEDNVVNSADAATIKNNFLTKDQAVLEKLDLNLDGQINALDYALIISTLSIRVGD